MAGQRDKAVGIAVVGCGRIGSLRAQCLSRNTAVKYLAVCDLIEEKARALAAKCGDAEVALDYRKVIEDPRVDAVIISTGEDEHYEPLLAAARLGKTILVEKPFVLRLNEAAKVLEVAGKNSAKIFIGYTQRFRRRFLTAKEQVESGFLGGIDSAFGKIYVTQAVGEAVISRAPETTPSINTLTYQVDMMLWYFEGKKVQSVYAQSVSRIFRNPQKTPDATWAILKFDDESICTLGVSWQLPKRYPAYVCTMELELFGPNGTLSIDDSHREYILASESPIPASYTPDVLMNTAFIGSAMPGDWALGHYWGPLKEETDAFMETVISGVVHPALATGDHGYRVLELTLAIDRAAREGKVVTL